MATFHHDGGEGGGDSDGGSADTSSDVFGTNSVSYDCSEPGQGDDNSDGVGYSGDASINE